MMRSISSFTVGMSWIVQTCMQASSTRSLSVSNGRVSAGCCQF